jgi:hypothetical protein
VEIRRKGVEKRSEEGKKKKIRGNRRKMKGMDDNPEKDEIE